MTDSRVYHKFNFFFDFSWKNVLKFTIRQLLKVLAASI